MQAINLREASRFVVSGCLATLGNLLTVAITRTIVPYGTALICGVAAGMTLSFLLTKFFAFRSKTKARAAGEVVRFLIVYGFGVFLYYFVALATKAKLIDLNIEPSIADFSGVIAGAATMMVTGYLGHRFFTYRTGQEAVDQP